MAMRRVLFIGFGGFLGTIARYALGEAIYRLKHPAVFPYEIIVVNVLGCLVIGFLAGIAEARGLLSEATRAFLFIGILGGFTTFSSFAHATMQLFHDGHGGAALWSVILQVVLALGAVWIGELVALKSI